jgi:hypothetical protein
VLARTAVNQSQTKNAKLKDIAPPKLMKMAYTTTAEEGSIKKSTKFTKTDF